MCVLSRFSHIQVFAAPWTVARQPPLSAGFSRQESCSGLPFPSPGNVADPGRSPISNISWQAGSLPRAPSGKSLVVQTFHPQDLRSVPPCPKSAWFLEPATFWSRQREEGSQATAATRLQALCPSSDPDAQLRPAPRRESFQPGCMSLKNMAG